MSHPQGSFLRGSVLSSVGTVATMACGLLTTVAFTNAFDRDGHHDAAGIFAMLILFSELITLFHNFGLSSTLPKLVAGCSHGERTSTTWSAIYYQAITSLSVCGLLYILWFLVSDPSLISNNESWLRLYPYLWALPPLVLLGNLRENALAALAGFDLYGTRALGLTITSIFYLGLVLVLVWGLEWGLWGLIGATIATYLIGAIWFCAALPRFSAAATSWKNYKRAVSFSSPLYANSLLGFGFLRCDTLLVAWLMGPAQAAYFEFVAKRFSLYLNRVLVSALTPFLPGMSVLAARRDHDASTRMFNAVSSVFTVAGYVAVLVLMGAKDWLVHILFPPEYTEALAAMGLVLGAGILNVQAGIAGLSLVALERPKAIIVVNVIAVVLSITCNLALVPIVGMVGAGLAAVASAAFSNVAQAWCVKRVGMNFSWLRFAGVHLLFAAGLAAYALLEARAWMVAIPVLFFAGCLCLGFVRKSDFVVLKMRTPAHAGIRGNYEDH